LIKQNLIKRILIVFFVIVIAIPYRLWFSLGPFKTISVLEITIWILTGWLFLSLLSRPLKIGPLFLFYALCVPILVAMISLIWSENLISTVKMIFCSVTAVLGYLLIINLFNNVSSQFILNCIGLFVIIAVLMAILYWFRVPIILEISGISPEGVSSSGSSLFAAKFARLNNPFLGKSNDFAPILSLYLFFFIGIGMTTSKISHISLAFLSGMGLLLTLSRGAIIVSSVIILFLLMKRLSIKTIAFALISLFLLSLIFYFFITKVEKEGINILERRLNDPTYIKNRLERFYYSFDIISRSPLVGYGGGNYMGKDVEAIDAAFHNTYLQQLSAYGILFGSIVIFSLLILPWIFFRLKSEVREVKTVARLTGLAILSFLIICTNQTANEALIPSLMFRLFLGFSVAYLSALNKEQRVK
jgi:O-antigen ligase